VTQDPGPTAHPHPPTRLLVVSVTLAFAFAAVVAVVLVIATRQAFELAYYRPQTGASLGKIEASLHTIGEIQARVDGGGLADSVAQAQLAAAAAAAQAAVAPLTASARLHGTFLESQDVPAQQLARLIEADLQQLSVAVYSAGPASTSVAARIDHMFASAAGPGSMVEVPAGSPQRVRALWLKAYTREMHELDADFQEHVEDFREWRTSRLLRWIEDDRWDDMQFRGDRLLGELHASSAAVAALPVPPEMQAAAVRYDLAQPLVERALASFADYVKGRAGVERLLGASDADFVNYKQERAMALAEMNAILATHGVEAIR
jgi:hypothetical protein